MRSVHNKVSVFFLLSAFMKIDLLTRIEDKNTKKKKSLPCPPSATDKVSAVYLAK